MNHFSKETIPHRKIVGAGVELADAEFERCSFEGGALVQYDDPTCGLEVRNVVLRRCKTGNAVVHGVRFDEVLVDGLTHRSPLRFESCLLRHVTLRGRIGPIMFMPASRTIPDEMQQRFREHAAEFYADIDWALDITEAQFSDVDLTYLPGHLVRRDPEHQLLVHKEPAAAANRDDLPAIAAIAAERAAKSPYATTVAAVPTRSKNSAQYQEELEALRARGIAE